MKERFIFSEINLSFSVEALVLVKGVAKACLRQAMGCDRPNVDLTGF